MTQYQLYPVSAHLSDVYLCILFISVLVRDNAKCIVTGNMTQYLLPKGFIAKACPWLGFVKLVS